MKLYEDLRFVGENIDLIVYGDTPWHCTSFVKRLSTGEMEYVLQQPHYYNETVMGYTNLSVYVLTEDELVRNFKIIKEDGSLEDITHMKDNEEHQKRLKEIQEKLSNISDEEFINILNQKG